jgi:hypothetical protein
MASDLSAEGRTGPRRVDRCGHEAPIDGANDLGTVDVMAASEGLTRGIQASMSRSGGSSGGDPTGFRGRCNSTVARAEERTSGTKATTGVHSAFSTATATADTPGGIAPPHGAIPMHGPALAGVRVGGLPGFGLAGALCLQQHTVPQFIPHGQR